jgi:predicted nucleotidyltransferase
MNTAAPARIRKDPFLAEIKRRVTEMYGDRIKRVVLYGSRARGDHRRDSDYDVAVFLRDYDGSWSEVSRLADVDFDFLMKTGKDVSIKPFRMVEWRMDTLFMRHLRRDGVEL